ncbi:MAG: hypothetical protein MK135_14225, partial [Polyangiaceae bacterium]|nr:hypothetical protein [Polyangiaceae bacterium]
LGRSTESRYRSLPIDLHLLTAGSALFSSGRWFQWDLPDVATAPELATTSSAIEEAEVVVSEQQRWYWRFNLLWAFAALIGVGALARWLWRSEERS